MHDDRVDLLTLVEQGGCSAKLPAAELELALSGLSSPSDPRLLVDISTHDDAGVYKISEDMALIQTTDFFPPVCSDPYDFGQIAATNALSDVYAMGGKVLTALNIMLFPVNLPLAVLREILKGGQEIVSKAGGFVVGGHTIANEIPIFGLAVTGCVHPKHLTTNSKAKPGDMLILTKPLGTGIVIAAQKNGLASEAAYAEALFNMKQLNDAGAVIMNKHNIIAATDITGFGLIGHAMKMADASRVTFRLFAKQIPAMNHVDELIEMGCIPGSAFRNKEFAEQHCHFEPGIDYNLKMLLFDAQTSGGLLMAVPKAVAARVIDDLHNQNCLSATIIGEVIHRNSHSIQVVNNI
jgi:selenide, water dikinase